MSLIANLLVSFVATLHLYILILEMFLWTSPRGLKAFNLKADFAQKSKVMAANQGLYNGFLVGGLAWGLVHPVADFGIQIKLFFLSCIAVAGIFGAATSSVKIFFVQTVPATASIIAVLAA
ncbi:hypothetical protein PVAG01_03469 [Phlyctema vagabunda]|uniref:DUF1304 domain-containing protein n=1 Tax=Phlyctema vagabunda TaxID=108571 RepID=A0ABR4PLH7_9HELO